MKIFKAKQIPYRKFQKDEVGWVNIENWAIIIDGFTYYGAHSKEDLQKACKVQPLVRFYEKNIVIPYNNR